MLYREMVATLHFGGVFGVASGVWIVATADYGDTSDVPPSVVAIALDMLLANNPLVVAFLALSIALFMATAHELQSRW